MFELKSVNKTFHLSKTSSLHVLSDVSLTVNQGEIFGLIGLSGAGKSTALRTFNLLEKPNSGQVIINNQILSELKSSELQKARQKIGMIFQHFNLISNKTVAENIALPLKIAGWKSQDITTRVEEVLQLVNLSNKRDVYPNQLSGGQKQRVSIARTMANHPHLLLADEPTSALDPFTKMEILDYLVSLNKNFNLTMIIATHEMQIVRKICNRVAIIDGGRVQEILPVVDGVIKPVSEIGKTLLEVT